MLQMMVESCPHMHIPLINEKRLRRSNAAVDTAVCTSVSYSNTRCHKKMMPMAMELTPHGIT